METATVHFEGCVPTGGFKLERRKGKTPEGSLLTTDWLVPAVSRDDVAAVHPITEQPCLHRVLADCPHDQVVNLASLNGLLTVAGKVTRAGDLPPEPVDTWYREIRALRSLTALWDGLAAGDGDSIRQVLPQHRAAKGKDLLHLAREHLARKLTEKLAGGRLELIAPETGQSQLAIRHRPLRLIDAIWQRFAEEISGVITCARCPAPGCGRWFLKNIGRRDRQFCSHACQMRTWRALAGRQ